MRLILSLLFATLTCVPGLAGCAAPATVKPPGEIELGFRRLIETGSGLVSGTVMAPAALVDDKASLLESETTAGGPRLNEAPLKGARISALDETGKPLVNISPVTTDANGRFLLRGLQAGRAYFLQAVVEATAGERRTLQAFVKPTTAASCLTINLASTLVATQLRAEDPRLLLTDKLDTFMMMAKDRLPALLDQQNGHQPGLSLDMKQLIDSLTSEQISGAREAGTKLLEREPAIQQALRDVSSASLDVSFTVQALGVNQAPLLSAERLSAPMGGKVELVCRISGSHHTKATFWLDNERIAQGVHAKDSWVAQLDTTTRPDGPYILTVVAESAAGEEPLRFKTLISVNNTQPKGGPPCGAMM